ncbi:MAG: hypothetical protein ACK41C_06070 [Phenylobacterium sp.]|jgi:DNA-directed RNA polymerase subunit RPC12/RpoP|uniref:hypothetical protein n=1 Tax=Phenylobacterium sp. TaxID=1871053 RepID=UPI003919C933
MSDAPRPRKILSLKNPPARPLGPEPLRPKAQPAPPPPVQHDWKCKPCGAGLSVPADLPDAEAVRCPNCNARLGTAGDFRADPPPARLRARPARRG